jgi:Holliday junction resolvase-like predicted endonuclease
VGSVAGPESPVLAVGPQKQARLRRLAAAWLRDGGSRLGRFGPLRFDVAGVWVERGGAVVRWEHLREAF